MGLFLEADETIFVLWSSVSFDRPVSTNTESSIITMSQWGTFNGSLEYIILIIPLSEEIEFGGVCIVADGLKDHIVTLLKCNVSDILHGLNEWYNLSIGFLGLSLQMLSEGMLVVNVVSGP